MEDVLNIDKIIGDRGFMASSSDDEEDTVQLSKVKTSLSNRLANIFAEEATSTQFALEQRASPEKRRSLDSSSTTLFSAVVNLYLRDSPTTPFVPKGRVGAAVIRNSTLDLLVFYTANKKALLVVSLGSGKIAKIEKDQRCRLVVSASTSFAITFVKSEDECKLTALLMLLCCINRVDLEEGSGIEVYIGSSVLYEVTPLIYDGASIKICADEQSKLRLSPKSEPWVLQTVGMKKSGKRLLRKDDKSVVLIHVKKIKQHRAADDSSAASLVSVTQRLTVNENFDEPKEQRREILPQRASLEKVVLPDEILLASETLSSKSGSISPPPVKLSSEPTAYAEPSVSCEIEDDRPERSSLRQTMKEQQQGQAGAVSLSADGILNVQKIIGAEIDRLEIRLVAALERMVDRQMSSLRGEMQEIKERQETLLKKLEESQRNREESTGS
ncbi:unnamed protein product [Cylicocyclus nassatus]|uniref:Uncharacterized protein n=1 Tax=Cylicocyclus nassatus TaxID=53992 RepID=A0AA36DWK6_CYLNA|nr:unnamed protein product [Cylicocyclus nassatus]